MVGDPWKGRRGGVEGNGTCSVWLVSWLSNISPDDICSMESAPVLNDVAGQHINIFLTTTVQPQLFTRGGCNIFKFFIHFAKKKKKKKVCSYDLFFLSFGSFFICLRPLFFYLFLTLYLVLVLVPL